MSHPSSSVRADAEPILKITGISKRFDGIQALSEVDFSCHSGRIHAVLGENGAGKSTLIKILAGVVQPDAGQILLDGQQMHFPHPSHATAVTRRSPCSQVTSLPWRSTVLPLE